MGAPAKKEGGMTSIERANHNLQKGMHDMQPALKTLGVAFAAAGVASLQGMTLAIEKEKARNPAFARSMAALAKRR